MPVVAPELELRSWRCWNPGWERSLSTAGARAGPDSELPSRARPPSLSLPVAGDSRLHASCPGTAPRSAPSPRFPSRGLGHSLGRGVHLSRPRSVPGAGWRGVGAAGGGRAAGGADGRRRWGERARVNKCRAQRARTGGGRGLPGGRPRGPRGPPRPPGRAGVGAMPRFRWLAFVCGGVSLALDAQLKRAAALMSRNPKARGALGVQVRRGGSSPYEPGLPLEAPSPRSDRLGGAPQDGDPLPAPRGLGPSVHYEVEQDRATRFPSQVSDTP